MEYLLRNIPPELWAHVKNRAYTEGHPVRYVLLTLLQHYVTTDAPLTSQARMLRRIPKPSKHQIPEDAPQMPTEGLLLGSDVARLAGVGEQAVRRWRLNGSLPVHCKFGKIYLFRQEDVDRVLESRRILKLKNSRRS